MIATKDFSAPSTSHHHECHQHRHPHQPHNLLIHFLYKGNLTTGYGYAVGHRYPNNVTNTFKSNQKMRWIKLVYVFFFFGDSNSCTFVLAKVKMRGLNFQLICNRKLDFLHPQPSPLSCHTSLRYFWLFRNSTIVTITLASASHSLTTNNYPNITLLMLPSNPEKVLLGVREGGGKETELNIQNAYANMLRNCWQEILVLV